MTDTDDDSASRPVDPAAEHGDSDEEVDTVDPDETTPFHDPAEKQVDDLFGGHGPLR